MNHTQTINYTLQDSKVNFIVQFTSVYTNILFCSGGRVEDEILAYKTEYLFVPSICTINDLYHDQ